MFYKLYFDMDYIDESIKNGTNVIFAEESNLKDIEYPSVKKGFFNNIILSEKRIINWPNVEFYYSSIVSTRESEFLLNIARWPIVHKKVIDVFEKNHISGVTYYPIKLIDVVTNSVNENYYLLYATNFIEAYDMKKSKYTYDEKYNFYNFLPHLTYMNVKECEKYDIFRCVYSKAPLFVSDRIKNIVESNNWIGFYFLPVK